MKKMLLTIMASLTALLTSACTSGAFFVANLPTHFTDTKITKDVSYGDEVWQKLDIYTPSTAKISKAAPVIVFFYGGRWTFGEKSQYAFAALTLAEKGYVVVVPDYAKYPQVKFPTFVEDGAKAISWAHDNIKHYGGAADNLFVSGHSSGAHIGALVSADPQYLKAHNKSRSIISGFAGLAGPYDFIPEEEDLKDMFGPESNYPNMQVPTYIDGKQPPILLLHGKDDVTVIQRNVDRLQDKINKKGGMVEVKIYPDMAHTDIVGALAWIYKDKKPVDDDIVQFFNKQMKINE